MNDAEALSMWNTNYADKSWFENFLIETNFLLHILSTDGWIYLLVQVGFDSFFYGRIDYQDRVKRKNEKSLEVVWQGSKSLGSSAQVDNYVFLLSNLQTIRLI